MRRHLITALVLLVGACAASHGGGAAMHDASPEAVQPDGGIPDAATAPAVGTFVVADKFDELATGSTPAGVWTSTGAVTVREFPYAVDKSAEVAKLAGAGSASLTAAFAPQAGRVVFEAEVLARETAGFKAIPYVYDAAGNAVASVSFQDGMIQAHVGGAIVDEQSFVANAWYRVRIIVDTTAGTFDLWIDGVRKGTGLQLRAPAATVASMSYYVDSATADTLVVDNVRVYTEATFIGAPPPPVFDARDYGAVGDGTTNDAAAIQRAITAAAGTGGSVVLRGGVFLSGTLTLGSHMILFIDSSATLRGSTAVADYPVLTPATGNTQLLNCDRALLYAPNVTDLVIDGGGTLDGQGDAFSGLEATRPILIWTVLSQAVTIHNVNLWKGAVWSLVTMETDHVVIDNVDIQSNFITHDGIDLVDGTDITVSHATVNAGDDAMCLKSGVRRGLDTIEVRDSLFTGNNGGSNGIKFGTATYGAVKNISIHDNVVKDVQYAAMAVESRQGSDISAVAFSRIQFSNTGGAFFVYLAQQDVTAPTGDVPKLGSVDNVSFTDIIGATASWANSPHQGSLITGHIFNGVTYPITNLSFTNVSVAFDGGLGSVPAAPPEAMPNQYPESNMFGDLPAWGFFLRHVAGVTFANVTSSVVATDARPKLATIDTSGVTGAP